MKLARALSMFITKESANFFFLIYMIFFALPFGVTIGLIVNVLIRRMSHEAKCKVSVSILDAVMGVIGFLIGSYVSFMCYKVSGNEMYGKLFLLFAMAGAVILPAITHHLMKVVSGNWMKRSDNPLNLK